MRAAWLKVETPSGAKTSEDIDNLLMQDNVGPGAIGMLLRAVAQFTENALHWTHFRWDAGQGTI